MIFYEIIVVTGLAIWW